MQITVKVIDGQVRQGIRNVTRAIPKIGVRALMRLMKNAADRARAYPPPPAGSRYVRTGAYGESFEIIKTDSGGVRLSSGLEYTTYVGGNAMGEGQAEVHSGRWMLIKDAVDQEVTEQVSQEVDADLTKVIRQEGFGL